VGITQRPTVNDVDPPQDPDASGFPILEDQSGDVAVAFGIRWSADDVEAIDELLGTGLVTFRGTDPWIVPMQARFVVGRDGTVVHAEIAYDYGQRTEPSEVLPVLGRSIAVGSGSRSSGVPSH
jgi:hypothetical protein